VDDATRIAWAESEFDLWGDVHPPFRTVHDLDARLPEECLWLVAPEFDTGFWATNVDVPSWLGYRAFTDPGPVYEFHKRFVQVLQGDDPDTTWVFKSPMHVNRLPALFAVYPDARIVRTHRDPARTLPSMVSTLVNGRLVRSDGIDPLATAATTRMGQEMMLNALVEDTSSEGRVTEVQYVDLLADPVATINRAFDEIGVAMSPELPDLVTRYLAEKPQNRHGAHRYSLEEFGLDAGEVRTALAPYIERFGVPLEG
jgi:hypothetical protein